LDRHVRERQPALQSLQQHYRLSGQTFRSKWSEIWHHRWGDAAKQLLMLVVDIRDIEKWWPWPVNVQWTVVENETELWCVIQWIYLIYKMFYIQPKNSLCVSFFFFEEYINNDVKTARLPWRNLSLWRH
jgi:hypothetical protein